jgi:(2R)-sulfolactate sulfo-lyase subunit beta
MDKPVGDPIEPVIKLTANPKTARTTVEHIDADIYGILCREMTVDRADDGLIDGMTRTCAEALGHRELMFVWAGGANS